MGPLRHKLYRVVFRNDTPAGKFFDIVLLWLIVISVIVVIAESVPELSAQNKEAFHYIELFFTTLFTLEYLVRIAVSPKPLRYIFSYWGIIDLLGIAPFYLSVLVPHTHYLMVFRLLRMLRVFRILRLFRFIRESDQLFQALRASIYKIVVFISFILALVVVLGTFMYVIEGPENGFTSIPQSVYWTIVTITTVGYGDITPQTSLGKWVATLIMLCGYAIIAVPTGLVTAEMTRRSTIAAKRCPNCSNTNPTGSRFCNFCGTALRADH